MKSSEETIAKVLAGLGDADAPAGNAADTPARFCPARTGDDLCGMVAGGFGHRKSGFVALVAGALVANHAAGGTRRFLRTTDRYCK